MGIFYDTGTFCFLQILLEATLHVKLISLIVSQCAFPFQKISAGVISITFYARISHRLKFYLSDFDLFQRCKLPLTLLLKNY